MRLTRPTCRVIAIMLVAAGAAQADPAQTLANGIAAYYSFDVNAEDVSGNGFDGRATPGVNFGPGKYNTAAVFTVGRARVELPDLGRYAPGGFTISAWVNLKALASPHGDTRDLGTVVGQLYVQRGDGKLVFKFHYDSAQAADNQERTLVSTRALPIGSWHQVVALYNPTGQVFQFVIDGVVDSSVAMNLGNARPRFPAFKAIGGEPRTQGDFTLNGSLDDVLIYRRPLTSDELSFLASGAGRGAALAGGGRFPRDSTDPANCGEYGASPCHECTAHFWWPPSNWGRCRVTSLICNHDLVFNVQSQVCTCPAGLVHGGGQALDHECSTPSNPAPVITVERLPSRIEFEGSTRILTGIKGFAASVTHAESADFLVPDGASIAADCGRLTQYKTYACTARLPSCSTLTAQAQSCETAAPKCNSLGITDNNNRALKFPLYTLEEWQNLYPTRLKVNANWFDINGPPNFPHISPCTDIYGYSVTQGQVVSPADNPDVVGNDRNYLDALVVIDTALPDGTTHRTLRIVKNAEIASLQHVSYAVGGFILFQDGKPQQPLPSSVKAKQTGGRTGVGLSADNQTLYFVVAQGGPGVGQMTAADLVNYMRRVQGAATVMNLDNSGSSQLIYQDGSTTYKTEPGDDDTATRKVYRPVPNFFGVR